ncbi:type II toxin-antitoxin system death-on-curing family toxin [Paenibacillus lautus]|uniref:type II toxin-antitoxin system death-on-curing family toxin n=1 Tax=Paenibacillus lautus TaxID=1401 RepID=UPI002DB92786|nr:type II toxin-antitoxin system death-on-curing family toxin [Paenibacillus lautus]MEC0202127.1 type II toxin-antitoxin system death-on-curing family toxin [Paenibacillus lautus]
MSPIRYLTSQEVIAINVAMIQKYSIGEHIGVKNSHLLESALHRPQSSAFGEDAYLSIREKSAALFESMGQNHPFQNANKRTAFTALLLFLRYNGYRFITEPKQAEDFTVDMVNHKFTFQELTSLIKEYSIEITP